MTTARKIYSAALRAKSQDELLDIIGALATLQAYNVFPEDEYNDLGRALSALYWSDYYNRVMINVA